MVANRRRPWPRTETDPAGHPDHLSGVGVGRQFGVSRVQLGQCGRPVEPSRDRD